MNILIGKYGKSCLFDEKTWGIIGGDEAPSTLFINLANKYPQHTFYMVGRSDLYKFKNKSKLNKFLKTEDSKLEIPKNLIDVWSFMPSDVIDFKSRVPEDKTKTYRHEWVADWFHNNNVKLDLGLVFSGPNGATTIPYKIIGIRNPNEFTTPIEMVGTYSAPLVNTLNKTGVPHILLCEDPRYIPITNRDTYNVEKGVLSQLNENVKTLRIQSYEQQDRKEHTLKYTYSKIETIFLMREKKVDFRNIEKTNKIALALNGGWKVRETAVEEWVLKKIPDCKIYGHWEDSWYEKYPNNFENVAIRDMEPLMWNTKYTLIPPTNKSNFVTQKFWKMLYYGIVPFFHSKYDTDKLLPIPDFLRCKSPADFHTKIEYLENNPKNYKLLLNEMYKILDDGYFDGSIVINEINKGLREFIGFDLDGNIL